VENLQASVGPYPFTELDIVDAPGAFGGIEYPGLILIGVIGPEYDYEIVIAHEVGHQWFYSLIGDDQLLEPWLDEAAASYTEVLYEEYTRGSRAAAQALDGFWQYLDFTQDPTAPIGWPIEAYPGDDYYPIVYGKGPLFFDALRRELGDETFFNFLRAYFAEQRYGFATTRAFHASAEAACACELDELFDLWVYEGGEVERP
jgi:aminopeptidase N